MPTRRSSLGPVTDEYLAAMRAIWGDAKPSYQGRFVSFANVQAHPQPVQRRIRRS